MTGKDLDQRAKAAQEQKEIMIKNAQAFLEKTGMQTLFEVEAVPMRFAVRYVAKPGTDLPEEKLREAKQKLAKQLFGNVDNE